jgi:hypothetical protein
MQACLIDPHCVAFTYFKPGYEDENAFCYLSESVTEPEFDECCVSGVKPGAE